MRTRKPFHRVCATPSPWQYGAVAEERSPIDVVRMSSSQITAASIDQAASLLRELVAQGAALGWQEPPPRDEVEALLREVADGSAHGDACLVAGILESRLVGIGYWRRYARATHWPHVDIEKVAVAPEMQGHSLGRRLMEELVAAARDANAEVITLDLRADNDRASALYESLGFVRYGVLPRFVAVGADRYDKYFYALDLRKSPSAVQ